MPLVLLKAGYLVEAYNRLGYGLYNVGSSDLVLGAEELAGLMARSRFPWISSNLRRADGRWFARRSLVAELGGVRVGFLGLLSPEAPLDESGRRGDFFIEEPAGAARETVSALRGAGCRLVIALSSLGLEADKALARTVGGLDVVLGGWSRSITREPEHEGHTLVAQAGSKGSYLAVLELWPGDAPGGAWVEARGGGEEGVRGGYRWSLQALDSSFRDDPAMTGLLDLYGEELKLRNMPELVRTEQEGGPSVYTGAGRCRPCHAEIFSEWATSSHAQAWAVLERKVQDYNPECLACHTTGWGMAGGFSSPRISPHLKGVQCEACHGPASLHHGRGDLGPAPGEPVCRRCHDGENSPEFEWADYLERLGGHARGAASPGGGPP